MNTFTRAIALILTVLMVAIIPLRYMAINQIAVNDSMVEQETKEFADEIMTQGFLSMDMYNDFVDQLSVTDQMYDIDLIHSKLKHSHDVAAYNHQEEVIDINIDVAKEKENINQLSLVKSDNEFQNDVITLSNRKNTDLRQIYGGVLEENSISSFATHTHTADCYSGHRHDSNCTIAGDMTKKVNVLYEWIYLPNVIRYFFDIKCATCSNVIFHMEGSYYSGGYPQGGDYVSKVYTFWPYYSSGGIIDTSYHSFAPSILVNPEVGDMYATLYSYCRNLPNQTVLSNQTRNYAAIANNVTWALSPIRYIEGHSTNVIQNNFKYNGCVYCGRATYGQNYSCGQIQDETPICNQVVTSIVPTAPTQTVKKNESIVTTATATYLDGHTGIVNCTSNFNPNLVGTQIVTLTYSGKVVNAKTTGTVTCSVSVTVNDNTIPVALTVTPSSYTVYNGSEPTYAVEVTYQDGSKKMISSGYTKTGFTIGAGTKEVVITYSENNKTVTATIIIIVKRNLKTCVNGHNYELDDFDTDLGCPICNETIDSIIVSPDTITIGKGSDLNITVTARYQDNHTAIIPSGWTSNFDNTQTGEQLITIEYMGKTAMITVVVEDKTVCPICGLNYIIDEFNPGCPVCSIKVVSITATPNIQTIPIGGDIAIEVEAVYQDGHTSLVTGWTSNFNPFKVGSQEVNITYDTAITTITVIVDSGTDITCPICGTTYSLITNPDGCPVCSVKIDHIEARLRSEGTKVQLGSELNLYIIVVFKDNHKEKAYSDWEVEGFSSDVLGEQTLTVKYKSFETTINIEVINTLDKITCPNGHVYYLNEDGSDPGCPYCNIDEKAGISTNYNECIYTVEIIEILYEEGIYNLEKGDYFTVEVQKKTLSVHDRLRYLWNTEHAEFKKFTGGGMVNN